MTFDIAEDVAGQRLTALFPFIVPLRRSGQSEGLASHSTTSMGAPPAPRYGLMRKLGSGGCATVFLARPLDPSLTTLKHVAIKFVETNGTGNRRRSLAEIRCLARCSHISLLTCVESFSYPPLQQQSSSDEDEEEQGSDAASAPPLEAVALVLEYCDAGDVSTEIASRRIANRPFTEHEALMLFLQVTMGVHALHSANIMHRDIKSSNVLLCSNGIVKLADFGFCKEVPEGSEVMTEQNGSFCGTPFYLAPELWERRAYSGKADIFALGVVLYELLTLRRPFDDKRDSELLPPSSNGLRDSAINGRYEPLDPSVFSVEVRELVGELLSPDPQDRPDTAAILSRPVLRVVLSSLLRIATADSASLREGETQLLQQAVDDAYRAIMLQRSATVSLLGQSPTARIPAHAAVDPSMMITLSATSRSFSSIATLKDDASSGTSTANSSPNSMLPSPAHNATVVFESAVLKEQTDGQWKQRHLRICFNPTERQYELILKTSPNARATACYPLSAFYDAFPVPSLYEASLRQKRVQFSTATTPTATSDEGIEINHNNKNCDYYFFLIERGSSSKRHVFAVESAELRSEWTYWINVGLSRLA